MAEHKVFCVKLKKELPGLDELPFDTELGQKIYDNVSLEAWKGWTEFCKMLLNEYRLTPIDPKARKTFTANHRLLRFNHLGPCKIRQACPAMGESRRCRVAWMRASSHPALYGLAVNSDGYFQAAAK